MAETDRYPPGDQRNCPKCNLRMECIGNLDGNQSGLCLWQCSNCKRVELIIG